MKDQQFILHPLWKPAPEKLLHDFDTAVVVAVSLMRMMQVAIHQIVNMISVRNGLMAAIGTMHMLRIVTFALVSLCAVVRVGGAHLKLVFIDVAFMRVVQVAVMQEVGMTVMLDGDMAAVAVVLMGVVRMRDVLAHGVLLLVRNRKWVGAVHEFSGVRQAVHDQAAGVLVGQGIDNVFSHSLSAHDVFGAKNAQPL